MTEPNDNKTTVDVCYIETRPRGRPRKYGEKGSKEHLKESKYHQNYYHKTNQITNCDLCGLKTTLRTITKHKQSNRCLLIRLGLKNDKNLLLVKNQI